MLAGTLEFSGTHWPTVLYWMTKWSTWTSPECLDIFHLISKLESICWTLTLNGGAGRGPKTPCLNAVLACQCSSLLENLLVKIALPLLLLLVLLLLLPPTPSLLATTTTTTTTTTTIIIIIIFRPQLDLPVLWPKSLPPARVLSTAH